MKKYSKISLAVACSMAVSLFAGCLTGFAATPEAVKVEKYADVTESHWAYEWVNFMTDNGYIHGYPSEENNGLELYKPEQNITRAEFVTILYYMLMPTASSSQSFSDVSVDDWYYEFISKAVGEGYLSGYGDGTVKPNSYITREEASSIVYRAFEIDKYVDEIDFADKSEISSWAYEAIMSLAELGIVVGYTGDEEVGTMIQPKVNIKRAEVASLLANADKFYPAVVRLPQTAQVSFDETTGGTVAFSMTPKNTSDSLNVSITIDPESEATVTYTKGGTSATVAVADLAALAFTADELKNANMSLSFPNAKDGDTVKVKITVTDNGLEEGVKVVGEIEYEIEFGAEVTPEVTPTPTPESSYPPITGGGGATTTRYTVTYYLDGASIGSETVVRGNKLNNIPMGNDGDQGYSWYTDETLTTPFDVNSAITADMSLYAKVETRDRVVEALQGYQAMEGAGTDAKTENALAGDTVDESTEIYDSTNKTWWTNDMLEVIVTNDKDKLSDTPDGTTYDNVVDGKALYSTYNDVARYVVDNSDYFATAAIDSASKFEFIKYFRAMVSTIDAAANDAIDAYKTALSNGQTKEEAYEAFQSAAIVSLSESLTNAGLDDSQKTDLSAMALAYVAELVTKAGDLGSIKTELEELGVDNLNVDTLATMLDKYLIYAK